MSRNEMISIKHKNAKLENLLSMISWVVFLPSVQTTTIGKIVSLIVSTDEFEIFAATRNCFFL